MSKSNADFSAFDFNDSSDNSDNETRAPFLSRAALHNSSSSSNSNINNNNSGTLNSGNNNKNNSNNNINNKNLSKINKNSKTTRNNHLSSALIANNLGSNSKNKNALVNNNKQQIISDNQLSSSASNSSQSSDEDSHDDEDEDNAANDVMRRGRSATVGAGTAAAAVRNVATTEQEQRQKLHEAINGARNLSENHQNAMTSSSSKSANINASNINKTRCPSTSSTSSSISSSSSSSTREKAATGVATMLHQHQQQTAKGCNGGGNGGIMPQQSHNSDALLIGAMGTQGNNNASLSTTAATTNGLNEHNRTTHATNVAAAAAAVKAVIANNSIDNATKNLAHDYEAEDDDDDDEEDDDDDDGDDGDDRGMGNGIGMASGLRESTTTAHRPHLMQQQQPTQQHNHLSTSSNNSNNNNNGNNNNANNGAISNSNNSNCYGNSLLDSNLSGMASSQNQQNTATTNSNNNNNSSCNMNSNNNNNNANLNHNNNSSSNCNEGMLVRCNSNASLSNASHIGSSKGAAASACGAGGGTGTAGAANSINGSAGLAGSNSNSTSLFAQLSAAERKKFRHQSYSKNVYIGTKNAEKWEYMRSRLHFKNDVEFVAYLLNLADNDKERLANLPPPSGSTTPTKSFDSSFKLEPNLSAKEFGSQNSQPGENGACSNSLAGDSSQPQAPQQQQQSQPNQQPQQQQQQQPPQKRKYKKRVQFNDQLNGIANLKNFSKFALKAKKQLVNAQTGDVVPEVLDCRIAEKIKSEMEEKSASKESLALCLKKADSFGAGGEEDEEDDEDADAGTSLTGDGTDGGANSGFRMRIKKHGPKNMMPPAPSSFMGDDDDDDIGMGDTGMSEDEEEDEEPDEETLAKEMKNEQNFVEEEDELDIAFRSHQSCRECSLGHDYKACPMRTAIGTVTDAVDLAEWVERRNMEALAKLKHDAQRQAKQLHGDDDEDMDDSSQLSELETKPLITFAEASVPTEFELHNVEPNVNGVYARTEVRPFTKLGPLIGQSIQSTEISEGSDMKWIFEICEAGAEKSQFLLCDNPNSSNWLRYIRPAPTYDERNVNLVFIDSQAYFVTCRELKNGMELLYWSDDCNTMWRKKHWAEKTNCGGCNLKFDHPIYYRTHCSVFHDPTMSLTIRKYHCKVCGEAVLGKDNIMKHAAEKHEGKGAHQCQFCNKFFLRLSYLEGHRTYGCSANPNRTRPICEFCGRKYYRPQKLKAHIRRMHSGSRAAMQRHTKEVHARNTTVVSCPRCSKLFQNRSNLKIHMLTHSGVRPFKCAEPECNAAFTTKQCLQFHYKKVHNYTQEQMPKIERSVAYTFDAYSGGMKVDFLEQAPRRRRKSLEDQNSIMSSSMQSDAEFSDDNIFEAIKKSGKSIKDLCRNEPNLSLLSSKISSIFGDKPPPRKRGRKPKDYHLLEQQEQEHMEQMRRKQNAQLSLVESFLTTTAQRLTAQQQVQQVVAAAAAAAMTGAGGAAVAGSSGSIDDATTKMHMMTGLNAQHMGMAGHHQPVLPMAHDDEEDDEDDEEEEHGSHHHGSQQMQHDNNGYRHHAGMNAMGQNLVVSKGSKKWISDDDRHLNRDCAVGDMAAAAMNANAASSCSMSAATGNEMGLPPFAVPQPSSVDDQSKLMGSNRDFLSRLINSANSSHNHHGGNTREEDENSSFLDVVESNNAAAAAAANAQMSQYHHNAANATDGGAGNASAGDNTSQVMDDHNAGGGGGNQTADNSEMSMNALSQSQAFMSSFYNNANARLSGTTAGSSSSASMLVEAALNSVGNMIDNENNDLKVPTDNNINSDSPMSSHVDSEGNRFNASNPMDNLESELKMMKNLNSFPMQIPPLPMFSNAGNNLNSCNISPSASTPTNPRSNQNEVDVDAGSTPRGQHMGNASDADQFPAAAAAQHRTPPSPQAISPGRDYGMFGTNPGSNGGTPGGPGTAGSSSSANSNGGGGNGATNNISASSPLPNTLAHAQRRNASSVSSSYPEHELISPASSPSIPRYNFNNGEVMRHKHRVEAENERRHAMATGGHNHLSSDEENSIMPQNSVGQDMRMKFPQSQMDLMYSKYESLANSAALKYNNQGMDSPAEYRNNNSSAAASNSNDISDLQGLDMSSRSNVSASNYHHNFQLPSNASANLSGIGRYHHHIYDILSEREQSQQAQAQSQQQQHHSAASAASAGANAHQHQQDHASQLSMQQHQSAMHSMLSDQLSEQEHDRATSVDLSRTANYVVPSPPQLPYNHPHHDMLRMASLDLTPNTNMSVGNNRSFLSSQMQHQSRESLEHHRLLSTVEQHRILAASNAAAADQHRLLVDPTAHLLMEQNNRLLTSDQSRLLGESAQNRHMAAARGFGAYHQVASGNYHPGVRPGVLPSANHHASNPSNYHPFPAYY